MRWFTRSEFECNCGCGKEEMDDEFLYMLDHARSMAGVPFKINSGYRCEQHNKDVGGKPDSAHLKGLAADIECEFSRERYLIVMALLRADFHRIGVGKDFIHVDNDETKDEDVMWTYY